MTSVLPSGNPGYFYGSGVIEDETLPLQGVTFKTYNLPRKHRYYGKAVLWSATYNDLRGGFRQFGSLADVGNAVSSSTLQHTFPGFCTLPVANTAASIGAADIDAYFSCWSQRYQVLFIAGGTTANLSVWDDNDSAALNACTYNPTGEITGIREIIIGGASAAPRLAILSDGAAIDVCTFTAATHTLTSAGSMHAGTNPGWDILTTPINATTPGTQGSLIYAGTTLNFLASSAAIGDAMTNTLTGINGGGVGLGIFQPKNMPYLRAFWLWPNQSSTTSMYQQSLAPLQAKVWHTNLEGTDPLPVPFPLPYVLWAQIYGDKLAATDGHTIYSWDGNSFENLGLFAERDTTGNLECRGLGEHAGNLLALNYTNRQIERYYPGLNSWMNISSSMDTNGSVVSSSTGPIIFDRNAIAYTPSFPVSRNRGNIYQLGFPTGTQQMNRFYQSPSDNNPFYELASGFEASGTATSPVTFLPVGLAGHPSVFSGIDLTDTDIEAGGTAATQAYMTVDLTTQSAGNSLSFTSGRSYTAYASDPLSRKVRRFAFNRDAWTRFQWRITGAGSTSGSATPNMLPFTLHGITFLDGIVRDPVEVMGQAWAAA